MEKPDSFPVSADTFGWSVRGVRRLGLCRAALGDDIENLTGKLRLVGPSRRSALFKACSKRTYSGNTYIAGADIATSATVAGVA